MTEIKTENNHSHMGKQEVTVVDVKMPFFSMVVFILKFAIASIPAMILFSIFFGILGAIFGGIFHGMGRY